ncbi:hypothetical protein SLEP1_g15784 [Rubroshorea leprosula]|uniref:Uncharacterized protein n=1 Tax=Rubroshorea leprosula TaxID=152421 RepID=A0AAV5IUH9_9ROSI|nr:hypothetical protein SLEP1_g15784 [Rubroshorea leprosula]
MLNWRSFWWIRGFAKAKKKLPKEKKFLVVSVWYMDLGLT